MTNSEQTLIPYSTFTVGDKKTVTMSVEDAEWLTGLALERLKLSDNYQSQQNARELDKFHTEIFKLAYK